MYRLENRLKQTNNVTCFEVIRVVELFLIVHIQIEKEVYHLLLFK